MIASIVFLPLLASVIAGIIAFLPVSPEDKARKHNLDRLAQWVTSAGLLIAMVLAWITFKEVIFGGNAHVVTLFTWIHSGNLDFSWALKIDTLTAVMLIVVTTISAMVHIYSIGYMHHDPDVPRFMSYLSLFTFFMLMLVTSDNLVQLFFGWEGVGLASYLLIGFWYSKPSANAAAIKAFVVNRVGDFGFALGIFATYQVFGSVNFETIFAHAPQLASATLNVFGGQFHALTVIGLLLLVGAMGKSAQLGLHTWLPDAMEGPTPVSALIHAATMVTAGVFMLARMSPLLEYSQTALNVITIVGGSTAIFAATIGCTQNDIKRVIAYSTCSQLGYMFFAIGVSAYSAAIFHLMTHAFFKALLFLGAGSVIHAMSDEQDMRKMGGIWKMIPVTYILMWVGSLALSGVPPFAGYFSKDAILEAAYAAHSTVGGYAFWMGIAAAFLTAFYSWRLILMTFHGASRADEKVLAHVHESPKVMLIPLIVLALGALLAGWLFVESFIGAGSEAFWGEAIKILPIHPAMEGIHHVPSWVKYLPAVVGGAGIFVAYVMYMFIPSLPGILAAAFKPIYTFVYNKWYFDELYDAVFVRPAFFIGRGLWKTGDQAIIDGVGPNGIASVSEEIAHRTSFLQSGYLYHYAFAMLVGVALMATWYLI
ncbi:NADH-quinone oxidoreductase subunit L [Varunaivibrio sulfuroxidans]|uniref:NADH-ubiquinone oxidoreductase chain 5 n=1 Tax=Varunaivibrio sulfuroxidans TaxID=1773489 RepID=A0A4R3JF74_9PROT|nr:NADH-quinone oxidoreductase subunit L [Varunaivibrio sulfuroxidans]TCS64135.1 NADH dehydrogenase subunit L [Varunaivibrio sulfuroxidans]WES31418.1 NADH-quinone oxidoreductase subunit L [Varunaivibrio sulfuroxidans]